MICSKWMQRRTSMLQTLGINSKRVQVLIKNGTFLHKFGSQGQADGCFNHPWGNLMCIVQPLMNVQE